MDYYFSISLHIWHEKTSSIERNNEMIKSHFENVARGTEVTVITMIMFRLFVHLYRSVGQKSQVYN